MNSERGQSPFFGQAQPSLDVLKKMALALHVSTDFFLFNEHERVPSEDLALQLEAMSQMKLIMSNCGQIRTP